MFLIHQEKSIQYSRFLSGLIHFLFFLFCRGLICAVVWFQILQSWHQYVAASPSFESGCWVDLSNSKQGIISTVSLAFCRLNKVSSLLQLVPASWRTLRCQSCILQTDSPSALRGWPSHLAGPWSSVYVMSLSIGLHHLFTGRVTPCTYTRVET